MKIWEVCKEENINKHYLDSNNNIWKVISVPEDSEEVEEIEYIDKEMGEMFYIILNNGKKVLLSLIEAEKD